ncbi:hypothetical protein AQZ49_02680 [Novosphingobium sp. FSW06-99]|nr:hypothetical protein AQZ49_02680 [Novosphingobium sp. FSW06-99]
MARTFTTLCNSVESIVAGARLLAVAQGLDPGTLETIVRKSARVACEATMQNASTVVANDNGRFK